MFGVFHRWLSRRIMVHRMAILLGNVADFRHPPHLAQPMPSSSKQRYYDRYCCYQTSTTATSSSTLIVLAQLACFIVQRRSKHTANHSSQQAAAYSQQSAPRALFQHAEPRPRSPTRKRQDESVGIRQRHRGGSKALRVRRGSKCHTHRTCQAHCPVSTTDHRPSSSMAGQRRGRTLLRSAWNTPQVIGCARVGA